LGESACIEKGRSGACALRDMGKRAKTPVARRLIVRLTKHRLSWNSSQENEKGRSGQITADPHL
jgi:hypothetical protein